MTTEQDSQDENKQQPGLVEMSPSAKEAMILNGVGTDHWLQDLVILANVDGIEMGVTLYVEGQLVSGVLIGGGRYFEEMSKAMLPRFPDTYRSTVEEIFADHAKVYTLENQAAHPTPPNFIHLRDARVHAGGVGAVPANEGVLWRGRLNAVSGFHFGQLTTG